MKLNRFLCLSALATILCIHSTAQDHKAPIDRKALVKRHNVINRSMDTLSSLTVGNGRFAFTVDATGLQSFPGYYENGVPLGTQSQWGWNSFRDTADYKFEETLQNYKAQGREVSYPISFNEPKRKRDAANWFRQQTHRIHLGSIGFVLTRSDGSEAKPSDISNIKQELDLWTGAIKSSFVFEGERVDVLTYGHGSADIVAARIKSPLLKKGKLSIRIAFPYPSNEFTDPGTNYASTNPADAGKHKTNTNYIKANQAEIRHSLQTADYTVKIGWIGSAKLESKRSHEYILAPASNTGEFSFSAEFDNSGKLQNTTNTEAAMANFGAVSKSSEADWEKFWRSGAAIDFAGSTDPRARELERRVILSQYLTRVQCAGDFPPQETGLTYNSWFGKPHLEMHWWHAVHFAMWGRSNLMEPSLEWYGKIKDKAVAIAQRQGFDGARWPKMIDNDGNESPSHIAAFLIWQQPHPIYMAELAYRSNPNEQTLNKYKDIVFASAEFMASYAFADPKTGRYILGPAMIPSQEVHKAETTINPPYELSYWYWGLKIAQTWKERLKLNPEKKWEEVMQKLSPLPQKDGVYLAVETAPDSYTNPRNMTDHPSVTAAYGMLPLTPMMDTSVMRRSYDLILEKWNWPKTWGWDFPMMAMCAARLNMPEKAVDALFMNIQTNTYLPNGHNYQDQRLTIYLPGNGGILTAVAMMCAGWDGSSSDNPGFPKNGKWKIRWEGLKKMP